MPIDTKEVLHIASLAQLDLDAASVERFRRELQAILGYVAVLDALDVSRVPPTAHPLELEQPFRDDEVARSLPSEEALRNAPDASAGQFRVPQVLRE